LHLSQPVRTLLCCERFRSCSFMRPMFPHTACLSIFNPPVDPCWNQLGAFSELTLNHSATATMAITEMPRVVTTAFTRRPIPPSPKSISGWRLGKDGLAKAGGTGGGKLHPSEYESAQWDQELIASQLFDVCGDWSKISSAEEFTEISRCSVPRSTFAFCCPQYQRTLGVQDQKDSTSLLPRPTRVASIADSTMRGM
jgi:hypothetical protein